MTKIEQLEREFEQALINIRDATDGLGLRINLMPRSTRYQIDTSPVWRPTIPLPADFQREILTLLGCDPENLATVFGSGRSEEALARNIALLAKGWEVACRYRDRDLPEPPGTAKRAPSTPRT